MLRDGDTGGARARDRIAASAWWRSLAEALAVIERLHDVLPHRRGRLLRLADWFLPAEEMQTLPANPRTVRPIPPYDPKSLTLNSQLPPKPQAPNPKPQAPSPN